LAAANDVIEVAAANDVKRFSIFDDDVFAESSQN
jgi:hypothetical protein